MNNKHTEEEYWLALLHAPGVGPVNFARLLKHFGSPLAVFEAGKSEWQALNMKQELLKYLQNPDWHTIEKDMQWLAQSNNYLLTLFHPDYPPLLQDIDDSPPVLFVHGDCTLLSSKQLAVVGTRHPTSEGEQIAKEFAEYLSHQGFTITSGMALGIDGAGHRGALAGSGKTIAVAGTGLDRVYPAKHKELAHKIAQTGALVSEFPPNTPVRREHFPRRSRIVSGLSLGILVIEAPENSGALYAARHAAKQGREVFAIPGSIHNPLVKGCHQLIKDGAKLVEMASDILEELSIYRHFTTTTEIKTPTPLAKSTRVEQSDLPTNPVTSENSERIQQGTGTKKTDDLDSDVELSDLSTNPVASHSEPRQQETESENTNGLDSDYVCLLDYLKTGPTSIDNLVEHSGLTAGEVSSMLLILELRGLVTTQSGGLYTRTN